MNELHNWLQRFGLNDTEIAIYLCILEHPHCKTADIQRLTGLVRTTIYYSLAELKTKGLLTENYQNNIKTYIANDPTSLSSVIESSITERSELLQDLRTIGPLYTSMATQKANVSDTHIARYEGEDAIKQALELAFRCESGRWYVLASYDNFLRHTSKKYQQYYLAERKRRGIKSKTLWEPRTNAKSPSLEEIVFRNPRVLPEAFRGTFDSLVILYDDTTLIVQPYAEQTAHAIHDPSSTHLMRLLFMSIWANADRV